MDDMTLHRKRRLRELLERKFSGSQADLARASGLTEGRISQLFDDAQSFGERSAKNLAQSLALDERYFEQGYPANDDYMQISRLTVVAGAGNGRPVYSEDIIDGLAFRKDFLRSVGITNPSDAAVIGVRGRSMGDLLDGAVVLVNKKNKEPVRNRIYVFVHGEGPVLKRVVKDGGKWIARSDSEDKKLFPDFSFEDGRTLIGRAVWMGAKL